MMQTDKKELKAYHGIIIFAVFMLIFVFAGAYVQSKLLLWGVAITEIFMLVYSVVTSLILKQDLKEVFPIKKTSGRQIGGVILFGIGTAIVANMSNVIIMYFFPDAYLRNLSVNSLSNTLPLIISVFIMSVLPGICEESLHRGLIQHTMKGIKKDWVLVLVMGVIFGLFHVSLYNFLPTAILGAGLTYIMLKTNNFILPVMFHFLNNFIAVMMSAVSSSMMEYVDMVEITEFSVTLANVGAYIFLCAFVPFLLFFGSEMFMREKTKKDYATYTLITEMDNESVIYLAKRKKATKICLIISAVFAVSGIVILNMFI